MLLKKNYTQIPRSWGIAWAKEKLWCILGWNEIQQGWIYILIWSKE